LWPTSSLSYRANLQNQVYINIYIYIYWLI
jgi:hypothetical protein